MASKRQHTTLSVTNTHRDLLQKRFKHQSTIFERLPNELHIEIFSYLLHVDIVYAFSQLNNRFQNLILNHCHTFDFKSINSTKFKCIIRQHQPERWRYLRLSNETETPGQIIYFFRQSPFKTCLSQLKNLSLTNMKPIDAQELIPQLKTFTYLVSLTIGNICGKTISSLELPSLKYLVLTSCKITKWMKNFNQLEKLEHTIEYDCIHDHNLIWPISLKQLKVSYTQQGDGEIVYASLCHLSQLESLSLYDNTCSSLPPDGQKWEKLITSSLTCLNEFQFCFKFWKDSSFIGDMNRIVSTFSTPFYLKEKQWFIQCDSHHQQFSVALLYSLPFAFERFEIVTHSFDQSISTVNDDYKKNMNLYTNVNTLIVNVNCENLNENLLNGNIQHLVLKYSDSLNKWIFSMTQIRQLSLGSQIDMSSKEFACLLKNTPYLESLNASYHTLNYLTTDWQNKVICRLLSCKILSLNLCFDEYLSPHTQNYVNVYEVLSIVRVFGKRCQHLTVSVYNRNVVAGLILRTMKHLHSLKVYLKEHDDLKINKEWLKTQNITFDCFINVNNNEYTFWFNNRH
ncbi:unnamed protein product [Adineta steineri]|uniref:F-box domain-containing protein n=1 Tax=Adineta steineri TaxID=433720 RepID=A0A813X490_9BILA|nr:unnamed protein product [Adineta steineri]CAF3915829.1 unnamed protein product [Adineta steineri]